MIQGMGEHVLVTELDDAYVTKGDVGKDLRGVKDYLQTLDGLAV